MSAFITVRKKPVIVQAWQFDPAAAPTDVPSWVSLNWWHEEIVPEPMGKRRRGSPCLLVPTLEGVMRANIGDWLIRGVQGEVYPCRPDIFEATYECVDEPEEKP